MEPIKKDKYVEHMGNAIFDKNRELPIDYVKYIADILNA